MKEYDSLTPELKAFVEEQHLFYVATAPPDGDGHVNVSPKGLEGTFQFVSPEAALLAGGDVFAPRSATAMAYFAYLDVGGSGIETHAHLQANKTRNITVMFHSFGEHPKILRFWGKGVSIEPGEQGWAEVLNQFSQPALDLYGCKADTPQKAKMRNIVIVQVAKIRDSCGFGVPQYKYEAERQYFPNRFAKYDSETISKKRIVSNTVSMDGLPGLRWSPNKPTPVVPAPQKSTEYVNNGLWFLTGAIISGAAVAYLKK